MCFHKNNMEISKIRKFFLFTPKHARASGKIATGAQARIFIATWNNLR
jgi:hypothetical protein